MIDLILRLRTAPVDNRPATLLNEAADEITRLHEENERLEKEIKKNRVALLRIQCIAQDITRPVPFQEENDEN